jgi:hypothetical protein
MASMIALVMPILVATFVLPQCAIAQSPAVTALSEATAIQELVLASVLDAYGPPRGPSTAIPRPIVGTQDGAKFALSRFHREP